MVVRFRYAVDGLLEEINRGGERTRFVYDAFGRVVASHNPKRDRRWIWDGGRPLHRLSSREPPQTLVELRLTRPVGSR